MFLTSRSAVEAYQDCPRYRYNQYYLLGKGVVPVRKSVPLVTGGAIHRGIEHLLNRQRIGATPDVEMAVQLAVSQYESDCKDSGFRGKGVETDRQQIFTYEEQKALVEGLIRAWFIKEFPRLTDRFRILHVERDIEPIEISPGVWFQAKVDAELQDIKSGDYFNYSLKTARSWGEREENSYKSDLQGITEIWAVEQDQQRINDKLDEVVECLNLIDAYGAHRPNQFPKMIEYLNKHSRVDKKVMGVRFCILIKGIRKISSYELATVGEDEARFITYSPLIRGFKNITPTTINYAHSWRYPNEDNRSGFSVLGKGWEGFNVWESDISIKQWVEALAEGKIQPECGDVLASQVMTPVEYFRDNSEMHNGIQEVIQQESRIEKAVNIMTTETNQNVLDKVFPHIRKHCEFHFGSQCEYKPLCWQSEVADGPLESGLYEIRMPHHDKEREMNK